MTLHKSLLFVSFFCFTLQLKSDIPKDLVKKILNATADFEQYEIRFEKHFKYPKETDTLSEIYQSTVFRTDIEYYVGWHHISYLRSGSKRSLIASNPDGMHRVNYKENLYYSTYLKDNEKLLIQNLQSNLYKPFYYGKSYLEMLNEESKTSDYIYLSKTDTGRDNQQRIKFISYTRICIDKKTFLPVSEEVRTISNGNAQYSLYKLLDYKLISNNDYKTVLRTSDSMISVIKGYVNADSLKKTRKDVYKKIKPGDSIDLFKAVLQTGESFDFASIKDSVVILDFFYTTCAPCIAAVPELNALYSTYYSKGLQLYGVNAFDSDWDNITNYVKDRGVLYPIIKTTKQTVYNFGVTGFPRLFVIKNGVVVKIYYGFAKGMDKELGILLEKLLSK